MQIRAILFSTVLVLILASLLAAAGEAAEAGYEGYFMLTRVTRVRPEGKIDVWPISVHRLPRETRPPAGTEPPTLPKVIATLEFKSRSVASRIRSSNLQGARISLRGKCEDLDRAMHVPVIQVRLDASGRWQQANLEPINRPGAEGFKQVVARVCGAGNGD